MAEDGFYYCFSPQCRTASPTRGVCPGCSRTLFQEAPLSQLPREGRLLFIEIALALLAEYDCRDYLTWTVRPVRFYVNVSDAFSWGCADSEEITPMSLPHLRSAFEDCKAAYPRLGCMFACTLYAARRRKMRPQGAEYPKEDEAAGIVALFNQCGPRREVGFGNPYPVPGEERKG